MAAKIVLDRTPNQGPVTPKYLLAQASILYIHVLVFADIVYNQIKNMSNNKTT